MAKMAKTPIKAQIAQWNGQLTSIESALHWIGV